MKLSIVMPVYNERATIEQIIEQVRAVDVGIERELVIVDDASTDGTRELLAQRFSGDSVVRVFSHERNRGKGAAVRTGIEQATGDVVLIQDADLEYDPNDYRELLRPIVEEQAQVVYGSRFLGRRHRLLGRERVAFPLQYLGNRFLSMLTNLLYRSSLTDMETCYKAIARPVLQGLDLRANKFDFEPEVTAKILRRGHRITEVPIRYRPRTYREGKKISWRDGARAVWTLFKCRFVD
jgi:glycosyltransferase involved in cell wall biosynthesis